MTKRIWMGTCTAIVGIATAAVTAQTPAPPQTPAPAPAASATAERSIVVTGCLKPAPVSSTDAATPVGTAGTAGTPAPTGTAGATSTTGDTSASDAKFILTNASSAPAPADAASATSTTSAAGTTASAPAATETYRLIANPSALLPLVGKKLELTGTIDQEASPTAGEPSTAPALRVKAGKILAASCSE